MKTSTDLANSVSLLEACNLLPSLPLRVPNSRRGNFFAGMRIKKFFSEKVFPNASELFVKVK